jgi:tetrahydrodipicolinate N-succinyltransferase
VVTIEVDQTTYPVELVRDVAKHHRSANIAAIQDTLTANTVVLIMRMTVVSGARVTVRSVVDGRHGVRSCSELGKTTLFVDAGLGTVGRMSRPRTNPVDGLDGAPLEGLL